MEQVVSYFLEQPRPFEALVLGGVIGAATVLVSGRDLGDVWQWILGAAGVSVTFFTALYMAARSGTCPPALDAMECQEYQEAKWTARFLIMYGVLIPLGVLAGAAIAKPPTFER